MEPFGFIGTVASGVEAKASGGHVLAWLEHPCRWLMIRHHVTNFFFEGLIRGLAVLSVRDAIPPISYPPLPNRGNAMFSRFLSQIQIKSARKSRVHSQFRPQLESLETRRLMAADTLAEENTLADAAIAIDGNGVVIGELNADEKLAMASTTKVMTNLLAAELAESNGIDLFGLQDDGTVEEELTIGFYPTLVEGNTIGMIQGDSYTPYELMDLSMGSSDNEATQALAEFLVANTAEGQARMSAVKPDLVGQISTDLASGIAINDVFTDMMNDRADELGMFNTSFRTPHGRDPEDVAGITLMSQLPNDGHYSTAEDLAELGRYAMQNETIADLATNPLMTNATWQYPGITGVKTGATGNAMGCLISQSTILGHTITAVVLGSDSGVGNWNQRRNQRLPDSVAVLDHGFDHAYGFVVDRGTFTIDTRVGSYDFNSQVFTIDPDSVTSANADVIEVDFDGDSVRITVNGETDEFPVDDFARIEIDGGAGDDTITVSGDAPSVELDIQGNQGVDTLMMTFDADGTEATITGPDEGHVAEPGASTHTIDFDGIEKLGPDDHGNTWATATNASLQKGCFCNVPLNVSGYLGETQDQDWFQFESHSGTITINPPTTQADDWDATIRLWSVPTSGSGIATWLGTIQDGDTPMSVDVEAGTYAISITGSDHLGQYTMEGSIPSQPIRARDIVSTVEKPGYRWKGFPIRQFDPIGPVIRTVKPVESTASRENLTDRVLAESVITSRAATDQGVAKAAAINKRPSGKSFSGTAVSITTVSKATSTVDEAFAIKANTDFRRLRSGI